jgi:CheY-like chemotaxis protein
MKIRALVVDDDKVQLKLLLASLKKLNFEGDTASNGEEAVNKIRNGQFDICFMDIQMPLMDGVEATKIIREKINKDIPIIAITAMTDFDHNKSIASGMNGYLNKPITLEQLKEVIAKHCGQGN